MTYQTISTVYDYYQYEYTNSSGTYLEAYYDGYFFLNVNALNNTFLLYDIPENVASENPFNTSYA
jgi:hypothetical protein